MSARKFSIITPSYSQLELLGLCVASIRDQSRIEIEHIIQDANSPGIEEFARANGAEFHRNGELVFAASCTDKSSADYSLKIISEPDQGMYHAINKGLQRATGDICAWLNCDEQYLPGTLEKVLKWFRTHADFDVLMGSVVVINTEGSYLCDRKPTVPSKWHTLVSGNLSYYSAAMFFRRSSVLDQQLTFDTEWKIIGDSVWTLKLLKSDLKVRTTPASLSCFMFSGDNLSHDKRAATERRKLKLQAAMFVRLITPLLILAFRIHRLVAGCYCILPHKYSIYTKCSPKERVEFNASKPTHRWPG